MSSDKDFIAAQHSLIDPLVEPDPSDETGLNSHFTSTFAPRQNLTPPGSAASKQSPPAGIRHRHTGSSVETNPYRRSTASFVTKPQSAVTYAEVTPEKLKRHDYPSPPNSASPRRDRFSSHRAEAFGGMNEGRPRRSSHSASQQPPQKESNISRSTSLRQRYPGDNSHRPLDVLRKDSKTAHRTHHLRKKNFQGADVIDRLDNIGGSYHHEGPYDAANISRNISWAHSPIAAVHDSNEEALRATPRENILDAVTKHRPLEGVANIPPGIPDRLGRVLDYEEGADLQRETGGDYRRWPGVEYLPGDLKGKGEPSYSIEKALKDHKNIGDTGTEMSTRNRGNSMGHSDIPGRVPLDSPFDDSRAVRRSSTTGKSVGNTLKKRFGSLRRRKVES